MQMSKKNNNNNFTCSFAGGGSIKDLADLLQY